MLTVRSASTNHHQPKNSEKRGNDQRKVLKQRHGAIYAREDEIYVLILITLQERDISCKILLFPPKISQLTKRRASAQSSALCTADVPSYDIVTELQCEPNADDRLQC